MIDVLDEMLELPGPYIVATAIGRAEAVYCVLELEGLFTLEAFDDEPYLTLGEARDVLSGLVLALYIAI
jgi:hypothetical protein